MNTPETSNGAAVVRVLYAVHAGAINEHEADAYLRTQHHITLDQARKAADPHVQRHAHFTTLLMAASALVLLLIISAIFISTGLGPTGLATLAIDGETATNTTYAIPEPVTSLRVSGTMTGEGDAVFWFDTGTQLLRVGRVVSDDGTPRTERASYQTGESVEIAHLPSGASVYLDDGTTVNIIEVPFDAPATSAEIIIVSGTDNDVQSVRIPLLIGDAPRTTAFSGVCTETCAMPASTGTLIVEITGDAHIQLEAIGTTPTPNRAPELVTPFAAQTIVEETRIDLSTGFTDPDGDDLLYSIGITDLVSARIDGSTLILIPVRSGTVELAVYASDVREIAETSISLSVVASVADINDTPPVDEILPVVDVPPVLDTTNTTHNETVEPIVNDTVPSEPVVVNGTLDCSGSDPNTIPVECLLANPDAYFPDEEVFLENLDRAQVAKLNMIGNLLLTGDIVQYSTGTPGARDFVIGQPDRDGNINVAAWVETVSGDLHLRGALYEAEISLDPPAGSYSIISKRSIYLAYVTIENGDLHLRGNVIPYRRSLT